MNKVISGKTILLNTVTNCTFVADDLDERVGLRDNHIEWAGELNHSVCDYQYREIVEEIYNETNRHFLQDSETLFEIRRTVNTLLDKDENGKIIISPRIQGISMKSIKQS